jgi:hypothetical protein
MAELTEPEVPATPAGDLVRAWMARTAEAAPHAALLLEVEASEATTRHLPVVVSPALLEHDLARRGIWSTEPDRRQTEFRYETEDVQGSLLIDYSLGQLSVADMRLVAWLLGRWRSDEAEIPFTMRRCTEEMGLAWKGPRARMIRDQLERIHGTRFKGRVYNARKKVHEEVWFGILDTVSFRDRRDRFDGEGEGTTIRVALSKFIVDNLKAAHFSRLDLGRLTSLRTDLAQRLYAFLESQRGFDREGANVYEIAADAALQATLGSSDRLRRFRSRLADAGEAIVAADDRYLEVGLRPGRARYSWVLRMRRRAQ